MQISALVGSVILVAAGAGVSALGFMWGGHGDVREIRLAGDQFDELTARLARIEKSAAVDRVSTAPAPVSLPDLHIEHDEQREPRRNLDSEPATLAMLQEIASTLKELLRAERVPMQNEQPGVAKQPESLAKMIEADAYDPVKLKQRHFCWTPTQLYAMYGMPDTISRETPQRWRWAYRIETGGGWIGFTFEDAFLVEVSLPRASR